jgi:hypothetical protein
MSVVFAAAAAAGCAHRGQHSATDMDRELAKRNETISSLESSLKAREQEVERKDSEISKLSKSLEKTRTPDVAARGHSAAGGNGSLLPPQAAAGECYARVFVPARFDTEKITLVKREAGERINVIPAQYEWAEERVLVKPASQKVVPVPEEYAWEEERVLDRPAHTMWKKGRGPIERVDNATGDIMCLVEVPASYKIVRKRVLKTPATTRTVEIPAVYETVKVRRLVSEVKTERIEIPAEYQTVTKTNKISDEHMEWRPVLCQTNATRPVVSSIQRALDQKGHSPGPIDGIIGPQTMKAVASFQKAESLPTGGLNYTTIKALGVSTNGSKH